MPADPILVHDFEPDSTLRDDVLCGLTGRPKSLPSQYLYDARGAALFERICDTEEYYVTRTEAAILRENMPAIAERIGPDALVIEPGSGSGVKTRLLLENLDRPAEYVPIDIARPQLEAFAAEMRGDFPDIDVSPVCADFTSEYEIPKCDRASGKRVVFFPGSTIGNFERWDAVDVLNHLAELCGPDGAVLIGVDLKKDRAVLEAAYDDRAGVSRDFAKNYLVRLNREIGARFPLDKFDYEAPYNEKLGRIEMALVSQRDQAVQVDGTTVQFAKNERVRTEVSYKYTTAQFSELAREAGLPVEQTWTDAEQFFSVHYLVPHLDAA
jgi:dimethylhistidine N-methyltransferase